MGEIEVVPVELLFHNANKSVGSGCTCQIEAISAYTHHLLTSSGQCSPVPSVDSSMNSLNNNDSGFAEDLGISDISIQTG